MLRCGCVKASSASRFYFSPTTAVCQKASLVVGRWPDFPHCVFHSVVTKHNGGEVHGCQDTSGKMMVIKARQNVTQQTWWHCIVCCHGNRVPLEGIIKGIRCQYKCVCVARSDFLTIRLLFSRNCCLPERLNLIVSSRKAGWYLKSSFGNERWAQTFDVLKKEGRWQSQTSISTLLFSIVLRLFKSLNVNVKTLLSCLLCFFLSYECSPCHGSICY